MDKKKKKTDVIIRYNRYTKELMTVFKKIFAIIYIIIKDLSFFLIWFIACIYL